ncbi:anti-repressor SinI family protein [Cytobacillus horneckiae]|nr:anti-repressor SinI family protein [Cytobacillus horneckiae]MCM3178081.1 anti-repressor SinI family protein [Cytobacillus horneckiae]MEC1157182.1 anti-repressor SinI family protein [Cytobacillus horneckiae]MED2938115.1 anti-repressor SinI family protein [Cytobacillus horneckiae]
MFVKRRVVNIKLDEEWIQLIIEAKKLGLSIKEIKVFLDSKKSFI